METERIRKKQNRILKIAVLITLAMLIAVSSWMMGLSPAYNGTAPEFRNIYEHLTNALAQGHLYLDIEPDPVLATLENPYDPAQREAAEVDYLQDASYYNGKYYCYFGPVPVALFMLPIKILTGITMPDYHVTQLATAMICIGFFALFYLLRQCFFPQISRKLYWFLSLVSCVVSCWYFVGFPAQYCVAISTAVAFEIWSIFCFVKAVWQCNKVNPSIAWAFLGALLGALSFGCRPTVALANLVVLPMLIVYLKKWWNEVDSKAGLIGKLVVAALPYFIIGFLLLWYNYVRFGNALEFGMAYQLTTNDVKADMMANTIGDIVHDTWQYFFASVTFQATFPYVQWYGGVFGNYPIFLLITIGLIGMLKEQDVRRRAKEQGLRGVLGALYVLPVAILAMASYCAIYVIQRYCFDVYWILSILLFIMVGLYSEGLTGKAKKLMMVVLAVLGIGAIILSILMLFIPYSDNFTAINPELLQRLAQRFPRL